ncbi:MAG TPA: hypothetical protein VN493_00740 [Thermoanaerobaculia bacterium]|nr:hypothetical protein [Thermoanaerobaculia bacterium]
MSTASMPMPGALRWRALHPLIDEDGACSLIYDLERAAVLEVPEELQLHVAPALETGDPDDDLLSWLVGEDLITMEGWAPDGPWPAPWGRSSGMASPLEGDIRVRIDSLSEEAAYRDVEVAFRQAFGAPRVQLHLDWDGAFPGAGLVERIVIEARRMAADAGQEVSFDLGLDAGQVTPAISTFLSSLPVHVRLHCGMFPGPSRPGRPARPARNTERALLLLWMEGLAGRVTVSFTLARDARLKELWAWARQLGVQHLDAVRVPAGPAGEEELPDAWLRDFHADLLGVVEEIARDLAARVVPIDFRPVTRIVRRLLQSEPLALLLEEGVESWPADGGTCCVGCWARYLCRNSATLISEAEAETRTPEICAVWGTEAEAALRLYHRLAQADPLQVLRVFGEPSGLPDELPAMPGGTSLWSAKAPC